MAAERFVTEDMTFVTALLLEGIHHSEKTKENGGCRWVYEGPVVERVIELLTEYNNREVHHEVKEFTQALGRVRQDMYQFLNYKPPRVRADR